MLIPVKIVQKYLQHDFKSSYTELVHARGLVRIFALVRLLLLTLMT